MPGSFFQNLFVRNNASLEHRLRRSLGISNAMVSIGFFGFVIGSKLDLFGYLDADKPLKDNLDLLITLILDKDWILLLAFTTWILFIRYTKAVKYELEILLSLFSRYNSPSNWETLIGANHVSLMSFAITGTFIALAWFVDQIQIFCLILLGLNFLDIHGNAMVRHNITKYFADPRYIPLDNDLHKPFIMRRRAVAEEYWIQNPQLERIALMMIAFIVAIMFSISEPLFGIKVHQGVPYSVVIITIIMNEYTMSKWRMIRNEKLNEINTEQLESDRQRINNPPPT